MPWIARDKQGSNPYRIFGKKPVKKVMVSYEGERMPKQQTWTIPLAPRNKWDDGVSYQQLSNDEPTTISPADCPVELEPGEGPIEVKLSLVLPAPERTFLGAGI